MRKRSLIAATTLAALIGSTALAVPSFADTDRPIPLSDAGDTVVDGVHQHIFLADRYNNRIVVTDAAGNYTGTTITGLPQVRDLELSPDGNTLYAALYGADKIVAIDTATLEQTAEYPTGAGTIPSSVVYADGKLWFGYGDQWESGLGVVDLTAETPKVTLDLAAGHDFASPPKLYADADNPGTLLALDAGVSSGPIIVYDVSSGTPVIRVSEDKGGFYKDAALTPDGQNVVVAGPGTRALTEYRLSDLAQVRTYPVKDQPETVGIAPDGTVAATVLDTDDIGDTYVFTGGPGKPSVRNVSHSWMPWGAHAISWSADGAKLFVQTDPGSSMKLHRINEPRKYETTLTVNAPTTAARDKSLTVTGKLTSGLALPAGTPLKVTRTDMESPNGKSLGTRPLGTGGKFSFTDKPQSGGRVTYTVTYEGDAAHTPDTGADSVEVSRAKPALTLNNNGKVYSYGKDVKFTARLGKTYSNRTVEIWADPFGSDKPNKLVKTGKVNSDGYLSVTLDLKRDTKVTAKFKGDSRYSSASASSTVGALVSVSTSVSNHYKSKSAWGHTYYFFHKTKDPMITTKMSYFPGRAQKFEFEVYYQGRWYPGDPAYFKLGSDGVSKVRITGDHGEDVGWRFRVRSSYINSTSGDTVNSTTHGAWKYFTYTR
ncbi:Ig-like domain repeat protein [Streptomyces actinomycinicus]|uniref:Ig-like domain repeat protein n=1 Tax=Streptomyces actinomycinicus TaxID=1695166 RepID=A0A937EJG8_9ACTN|nr:Ig-like domain repeat protein [Streptomyces actinomycinicus]MBL1083144.1 Ig-like domain repeat protein [Streptomyces actinomycinicus]